MTRWLTVMVFLIVIGGGIKLGSMLVFSEGLVSKYLYNAIEQSGALVSGSMEEAYEFLGAKPPGPEDRMNPAVRETRVGINVMARDKVQDGYTLYSPFFFGFPIRLTDMHGVTVHEWTLPEDAYTGERLDNFVLEESPQPMVSKAHVYPNGDLLTVIHHGRLVEPWGYSLARIDRDSNLVWKYLKQVHHGFDIAPDGRIAAMVTQERNEARTGYEWLTGPFQDDFIVILSPEGEELQVISVLDAIRDSDWSALLMYADSRPPKGDLLHLNSVRFLSATQAASLPDADEGDLLISLRNLSVVAVLDVDERTIKWAVRGPWYMQHDPQILDNGNLLVFDNRGDMLRGGASRVLEVDPHTLAIEWRYPNGVDDPFYTLICGSVERLKNGNTLISESNNGRIFEVTPQGEIVWDYAIPERFVDEFDRLIAKAWHAQRLDRDKLVFLDEAAAQ